MIQSKPYFDFSHMVAVSDSMKYRKEKHFYKAAHLVGVIDGMIVDLAEIRCYGTPAVNYACFWIHSPILGLFGHTCGKAGGYGYNREAAAIAAAADKMGILLTKDVYSIDEFLSSLAAYLGVEVFSVVTSHA